MAQICKLTLVFLVLVLSACNGITLYYTVPDESAYSFDDVQKASEAGGIYADVVGVNIALIGSILLFIRMFDAFTDPILGILSDHTQTRIGRRRQAWRRAGQF